MREQARAGEIAKLMRFGDIAGQLEARAQKGAGGTEAHGIRIMGIDGSTVPVKRREITRSISLVVEDFASAGDDAIE